MPVNHILSNTELINVINAATLNAHYAAISTDPYYNTPTHKLSASQPLTPYISEWEVFKALDTLRPTATGLDALLAWFLRLGAPLFCKSISQLFNLSLATSTVPTQWKQASIRPVPKVASPLLLTDFRPISVTPVLTRTMERFVVSFYIRALSPLHLPFLGRLPKVDLIILEGGKMSVRTSVRPSTKSFFDFNEIWYIGRGR